MAAARRIRPWIWCLLALVAAGPASAAPADTSWAGRLDPETAAAVRRVVDSARLDRLPVDPLIARALEGASRGARGPRVVAAVRKLAREMKRSRDLLGGDSTPSELVAASVALSAGVPAETLARLRPAGGKRVLVVPLVVLSDLLSRRVPVATAGAAVLAAVRAGVNDDELMRLRERIDLDIRSGIAPEGATVACTRRLVRTFEGPAHPRPAGRRGPAP